MYLFEATYVNKLTHDEVTRAIEFNGRLMDCERDVFLTAMEMAYDMKGEYEELITLEFLGC